MSDATLALIRLAFRQALPLMVLGFVGVAQSHTALALADDTFCLAAIATIEPMAELPLHLLAAISLAESGRTIPISGIVAPWPWTINVNGAGSVFDSKSEAIAAVQALQQAGNRSIDVGCMQINLLYHPQAFATLEAAFDPTANVAYAARFLGALHRQTGNWPAAVAAYHSATPERGGPYAQRVAALLPDAPLFGLHVATSSFAIATAPLAAQVDPGHTLTPTFRRERIAAAAFRLRQQAERPDATAIRDGARAEEVDPNHSLTPAFRARMAAAAAFRHRGEMVAGVQRTDASGRARPLASKLVAVNVIGLSSAP